MTKKKRSSFTLAAEIVALVLIFAIIVTAICADSTKQKFDRSEFPRKYASAVEIASAEFGVPENLLFAIIKAESNFDEDAVSKAGAIGLMQLLPSTFDSDIRGKLGIEEYGESALFDYIINIRSGAYYFARLYSYCGDLGTALAMYNAGVGNVNKWLKSSKYSKDGKTLITNRIPVDETRDYVTKVMYYYERYNDIYGVSSSARIDDPLFKKYDVNIKWLTKTDSRGNVIVNDLACYAWALHYCEIYPDADPVFVMAIIKTESDFRVNAVSSAGAYGLMQIMDDTYDDIKPKIGATEDFGFLLEDPKFAVRCGVYYINWLHTDSLGLGDNMINIAAAYNGGCGNVKKWLSTPGLSKNGVLVVDKIPSAETRRYVEKVISNYNYYREYLGSIFTNSD
jgi:soluble lytic murein transglycosylase